jgi:hypothetical protein
MQWQGLMENTAYEKKGKKFSLKCTQPIVYSSFYLQSFKLVTNFHTVHDKHGKENKIQNVMINPSGPGILQESAWWSVPTFSNEQAEETCN